MGNRAVVAFSDDKNATGIYLHWNGGPESVLAFAHAARDMGARGPGGDTTYAMAGLTRAVTLFMHYNPGELRSMGVGPVGSLDTDNFDNGLFIIDSDWNIKARYFARGDSVRTVEQFGARQKAQYNGIRAIILERHLAIIEAAKKADAA